MASPMVLLLVLPEVAAQVWAARAAPALGPQEEGH